MTTRGSDKVLKASQGCMHGSPQLREGREFVVSSTTPADVAHTNTQFRKWQNTPAWIPVKGVWSSIIISSRQQQLKRINSGLDPEIPSVYIIMHIPALPLLRRKSGDGLSSTAQRSEPSSDYASPNTGWGKIVRESDAAIERDYA